jgi:NAD(P)-dependent dehydrogenase (short-subunit alcohol dehydrogenase family)
MLPRFSFLSARSDSRSAGIDFLLLQKRRVCVNKQPQEAGFPQAQPGAKAFYAAPGICYSDFQKKEAEMNSCAELFDLTGRTAVVTGASSGLGETFARGLAAAGAAVVVAARRKDRLEKLEAELTAGGCQVAAVSCDVSAEGDVDRLVAAAAERFGKLDILINNAGVSNVAPAESEAAEDFRRVLDVNVAGCFLCLKKCGQHMLEAGRGSIVNIASMLGLVGIGRIPQAAYTASKGAVVNMTREAAAQWARRGVRVNAIAPGWFPSEMTGGMFDDERSMNFVRRNTPMGRPGKPEELVGAMLLLASDAGSFITGQTIVVDGGWTVV